MNNLFVFDTNILISAVFNQNSSPALAVKKARTIGTLVISKEILEEYITVFSREKFNKWLSLETRIEFIENIIINALPVPVWNNVKACRDPKDDKYLSLAVSSGAYCIVSGDDDLLVLHPFQNIPIISAKQFLEYDFEVGL